MCCDIGLCLSHHGRAELEHDAEHDGDKEKEWRRSLVLQNEALLLRKQALLQKGQPRLLHWRPRKRLMLLQEGLVSDANAIGTHLIPARSRVTFPVSLTSANP